MPENDQHYDVFLNYASEDEAWCTNLVESLENKGVSVWFAARKVKPGHNLVHRLNQGLKQSGKMVAVWSKNYFKDKKVWTLAESYAQQHGDVLAENRPLIPILLEKVEKSRIPPLSSNLIYIDFCDPDRFDLRLEQLIQALDLPQRQARYVEISELDGSVL